MKRHERGQILVLVAIFMVGLLVATGLAVDAGFLMLRKGQFDRALDSAVLSGATQLSTGTLAVANTRGLQFLAVNGIVIQSTRSGPCVNGALPDTLDYCGEKLPGAMPGAIRYRAIARWNVPLFFMPLIKINHVFLTADATAEYFSMVDVYAGDIAEYGLIKTATLALFGPAICTSYGDPYTPQKKDNGSDNPWYGDLNGVYNFRIGIPPTYPYKTIRIEIFDPASSSTSAFFNVAGTNQYRVWNATTATVSTKSCGNSDRKDTCTINTAADINNPWWFLRTDENRGASTWGFCDEPGSYTGAYETDTLFRLYYQRRTNTGLFEDVDLAYYRSGTSADSKAAEATATDNMWVAPGASAAERNAPYNDILYLAEAISSPSTEPLNSPAEPATVVDNCETRRNQTLTVGSKTARLSQAVTCSTPNESATSLGNFIVNLEPFGTESQETPNIYVDPNTGYRYIYLDVRGIAGASENGFQLWAGPSNLEEPDSRAPSYINARQVYIQLERAKVLPKIAKNWHLSRGLLMYGMGHLPMNHNAANRVEFPLAYLGTEFAGQDVQIRMFDPDAGSTSPIYFFFENMPKQDWTACFATDLGGANTPLKQCKDASGNNDIVVKGPAQLPNGENWSIYTFKIPSEFDPTDPMPFYGGRLMVSYQAAQDDTFGWYIVAESRPTLVGS